MDKYFNSFAGWKLLFFDQTAVNLILDRYPNQPLPSQARRKLPQYAWLNASFLPEARNKRNHPSFRDHIWGFKVALHKQNKQDQKG